MATPMTTPTMTPTYDDSKEQHQPGQGIQSVDIEKVIKKKATKEKKLISIVWYKKKQYRKKKNFHVDPIVHIYIQEDFSHS